MGLDQGVDSSIENTFDFNIFDGVPDHDSPWAQYIDQDEESHQNEEGEEGMTDMKLDHRRTDPD